MTMMRTTPRSTSKSGNTSPTTKLNLATQKQYYSAVNILKDALCAYGTTYVATRLDPREVVTISVAL